MTSLTAIFGSATAKSDDDGMESEKLLNLYWNRAELKKEFAELQNEKVRLQERVREHEGVAARAEQKLEQLENLLRDPEWVYSTVAHFQLSALYRKCEDKLATFAELLKQQREQRVHKQLIEDWQRVRSEEVLGIERQIGEQRIQSQMLEDRLQAERHRLATMSGFMKLFRGRSVTASLDRLADSIHQAQSGEQQLLHQLEETHNRQPPDTQGLDVATKRMINFMILAYAQQLFLLLQEDNVAMFAKESRDKSAGAVHYGGKQACEAILASVRKRCERLAEKTDFAGELQSRAQLIGKHAKFSSADDAVPISGSVSAVYEFGDGGAVTELELDLLKENYWNLNGVVSR